MLAGSRDEAQVEQADEPGTSPETDPATGPETEPGTHPKAQHSPIEPLDRDASDEADVARQAPPHSEDTTMTTAPAPADERGGPDSPDELCAAAVEQARAAAAEVAGTAVGQHLGVEAEPAADDGHVVTHSFATTDPAYVGWRWAVTVARADGAQHITVDEVVLLPGSAALLAPAWVPWSERVQPGDLGAGDLLPPPADDPRLVPSYADVDAEPLPFDLHRELGLGRLRVLSLDGRADAAQRWYEGEAGPDTPLAKAAPGRCGDCGFLVPLTGGLGRAFGACANGMAPDDGRVVALTHGCGAHSETVVEQPESTYSGMAVEHEELELLDSVVEPDAVEPDAVEPDVGEPGAGEPAGVAADGDS